MQTQRPRLLVVDDDRTILTVAGTGVTCLEVLRALRDLNPQCEVVLMTGYTTVDAALDAMKRNLMEASNGSPMPMTAVHPGATAPLVEVERDHIVRTLAQVRGNKAVAARMLGISRRAFYRQLERHGLHQRVPMTRRGDMGTPASPMMAE
jgi:two-component system response regulator RegA